MKKHIENLITAGVTAVLGLSISALAQFEGPVVTVPEPEAALVLLPAAAYLALKEHRRRAKAKKRQD
ncbi:hypothetical protein [Kordiimonas lacus]|uniref:PEP-CTERM protein-sorting domain-containing protein n=1 Tax=Kordiimonas lacus TaxID=637679 RepID=A0A1G6ZSM6_9PROT|nr:hypothetical protein [Kordiimonas lacus]SDE05698.1 hypothetical protein SAMN04488071_1938 [Kordiimonas lacus]